MTTASSYLIPPKQTLHLRAFDVGKDLRAVADLVEESFRDTIDADGHRYLQQMREAAQNPRFLRLAGSLIEQITLPLWGYVWEEDGRLVGNMSLIPFFVRGRRRYLIANVAVHPDYRRRGIARALTAKGIEHARQRHAEAVWLHVREENTGAIRLYQSLGFMERTRRTSWHSAPLDPVVGKLSAGENGTHFKIRIRRDAEWPSQKAWLNRIYPPDLAWHIPLSIKSLQPGVPGALRRFFNGSSVKQWSIVDGEQLLGVATWKRSYGHTDSIWMAVPPRLNSEALQQLLLYLRQKAPSRQQFSLDFPAHQGEISIQSAGFYPNQTLIWMSVELGNG